MQRTSYSEFSYNTEASLYGFTIAEDPISHCDPHNYPTQGAPEPRPTHSRRREIAAGKESR